MRVAVTGRRETAARAEALGERRELTSEDFQGHPFSSIHLCVLCALCRSSAVNGSLSQVTPAPELRATHVETPERKRAPGFLLPAPVTPHEV